MTSRPRWGEIKNKAKDGSFYWVDTTIVPFLNEKGKPRQYVAIRADITRQKAAALEIRELNAELEQRVASRTAELRSANQEIEAFSYSVSHDLRAPVRAVGGFANILGNQLGDQIPAEGHRALERIRENATRMGQLIDGLLAFASLGRKSLEKKSTDPESIARAVIEELRAEQTNRRVEIEIEQLPSCQPSLVGLDLKLPKVNGFDAAT